MGAEPDFGVVALRGFFEGRDGGFAGGGEELGGGFPGSVVGRAEVGDGLVDFVGEGGEGGDRNHEMHEKTRKKNFHTFILASRKSAKSFSEL